MHLVNFLNLFFGFLLLLPLFTFCKSAEFNNPCDLNSKENLNSNLINALSGNMNPFCTNNSRNDSHISISYPSKSYVFYTGTATNTKSTVSGIISACVSSPSLPAGLSLDNTSCSITGIPTTQTPTATYIITASKGSSNSTVSLSIRISGSTSIAVYGQFGSFSCSLPNNNGSCIGGSVSANNLNNPIGIAADSSGSLYIADFSHSRVLSYPIDTTIPTNVWGQNGSYITSASGLTSASLNGPNGVAVDSNGNVYIADNTNNRVLYFPQGATTPTRVYGQFSDFNCGLANNAGACGGSAVSADSLNGPNSIIIDSTGKIYIADLGNHRVLVYPNNGSTTAIAVYGQFGSFTCGVQNQSGICSLGPPPSASNLNLPSGLALDSSDNLYILDTGNNRVLYYPVGLTTATTVYGQAGTFSCGLSNNNGSCVSAGVSSTNLNSPQGITLDQLGNLYVADYSNNRVLFFDSSGSLIATKVYGHNNNFTCIVNDDNGNCVTGSKSASGLNGPQKVTTDNVGNIYISDSNNHRVLKY
jgi:sugar lactone lactonase YvrE